MPEGKPGSQPAPVTFEEAFPVTSVRVFQEEGGPFDCFYVTRIEDDTLHLEALKSGLRHALPAVDSAIWLESAVNDSAYRLYACVVACEADETVRLHCRQEGRIERFDRRKRKRLRVGVPVEILSADGEAESTVTTEDLNSIGMRICINECFDLGENLRLRFRLHDEAPHLLCEATVVRCRELAEGFYEVGLQFCNLDDEDAERIIQALLRRLFGR